MLKEQTHMTAPAGEDVAQEHSLIVDGSANLYFGDQYGCFSKKEKNHWVSLYHKTHLYDFWVHTQRIFNHYTRIFA